MKVVKSPHHALLFCGPHGNMTVVPLLNCHLVLVHPGHTPDEEQQRILGDGVRDRWASGGVAIRITGGSWEKQQ